MERVQTDDQTNDTQKLSGKLREFSTGMLNLAVWPVELHSCKVELK